MNVIQQHVTCNSRHMMPFLTGFFTNTCYVTLLSSESRLTPGNLSSKVEVSAITSLIVSSMQLGSIRTFSAQKLDKKNC